MNEEKSLNITQRSHMNFKYNLYEIRYKFLPEIDGKICICIIYSVNSINLGRELKFHFS